MVIAKPKSKYKLSMKGQKINLYEKFIVVGTYNIKLNKFKLL